MKLARWRESPEIFHTLQGEGISSGMPAVFVRAALCNLHCVWCDTDHTWNFAGTPWHHVKDAEPGYCKPQQEEAVIEVPVREVAERVASFGCDRVVLTGGEPLLQQAAWVEMLDLLRTLRPGLTCEVETNGTILPETAFAAGVAQYNVSPKLGNSGMAESLRIKPEVLRWFAASNKAWFKFVVINEEDLAEVERLVAAHGLPAARILLMPEGRRTADLDARAPWVAAACLRRGWRFGDRLQVRLWGDRRGV